MDKIIFILFCLGTCLASGQNFSWPTTDADKKVSGSFGSFENYHKHLAIDIPGNPGSTQIISICNDAKIFHVEKYEATHSLLITLKRNNGDIIEYNHCEEGSFDLYNGNYDNFIVSPNVENHPLNQGDIFATIANHTAAITSFDHVHVAYKDASLTYFDPLSFLLVQYQDPHNNVPVFGPLYIFEHDDAGEQYEQTLQNFIYGKIHITSEITDNMGDWKFYNQVPNDPNIPAWIGVTGESNTNVRSIGIVSTPIKIRYNIFNKTTEQSILSQQVVIDFNNSIGGATQSDLIYDKRFKTTSSDYGERRYCYNLTNFLYNSNIPSNTYWNTMEALTGNGNARNNSEAKYPDGNYSLEIFAEDRIHVNNVPPNQAAKKIYTLPVDNFIPYIKKVEVLNGSILIYSGEWSAGAGQLNFTSTQTPGMADGKYDLSIIITASEPMDEVNLNPAGLNFSSSSSNSDNTIWSFVINKNEISHLIYTNTVGNITLNISGKDVAQNNLLNILPTQTSILFTSLPVRDATGEFYPSPPGNGTYDTRHKFLIGCGSQNKSTNNCFTADFTVNQTSISSGSTLHFTDMSTGNPTAWFWDFGDGSTSNDPNPNHVYINEGLYAQPHFVTVKLKIINVYNNPTTIPEHLRNPANVLNLQDRLLVKTG